MKWMYIFLRVVFGAVVSFQDVLSNPVLELTVRPGENVTLYCDCKPLTSVYIVWFRNCSHEHQPTFPLETVNSDQKNNSVDSFQSKYLHYNYKWNISTTSYDLLITNISETHLGLYYCGTVEKKLQDKGVDKFVYTYGNSTTKILLAAAPDCGQCWVLLAVLCPSSALLLSLLSSLVVYLRCRRKDEDLHVAQTSPSSRDVTPIRNQDEDGLCYATLDIPLRSQRPKKKRVQPSEFSTYSAINTKRM